jgi:putative acetyltransferase
VAGGALTIRPAVTHDHDRLVEIWRAAVEATHHFLATQDVDWYERLVRGYLSRMGDVRVAEVTGGAVLGFVAQDDGEIHMLFIDPSHHGRGVGTALLDDIANDFSLLRVDVNEENPSGRRFYAARGFQQVGRSEIDGQGRPHPLLHLVRQGTARKDAATDARAGTRAAAACGSPRNRS